VGGARGRERCRTKDERVLLVIIQIIVIDMVFSLDSIITAIGMAQDLAIMIAAVVIASSSCTCRQDRLAKIRVGCIQHQDAGAGVSGADRGPLGCRRIPVFIFRAATSTLRSRFRLLSNSSMSSQTQPQKTAN